MKIQDRFIRLGVALAVIGFVTAQVPFRSSVASAADGTQVGEGQQPTPSPTPRPPVVNTAQDNCTATKTNNNTTNLLIAGGLAAAAGGALGSGSGGNIRGAALRSAPVYDVTDQNPADFDLIAKIIRNAELVSTYRANEQTTVFWVSNADLIRALGADRVEALQQTANQAQAKQFLLSLTVPGSYSLQALKAAARSGQVLQSATGQSVSLTMSGDKLFANGVEMVNSEYPATNGYVLVARGLISIPE